MNIGSSAEAMIAVGPRHCLTAKRNGLCEVWRWDARRDRREQRDPRDPRDLRGNGGGGETKTVGVVGAGAVAVADEEQSSPFTASFLPSRSMEDTDTWWDATQTVPGGKALVTEVMKRVTHLCCMAASPQIVALGSADRSITLCYMDSL